MISLYADNDAVFIRPYKQELEVINHIINIFAEVSGLKTNLSKIEFYPIKCDNIDLSFLTSQNLALSTFSLQVLGPPLAF
jgi:hypothetical protein